MPDHCSGCGKFLPNAVAGDRCSSCGGRTAPVQAAPLHGIRQQDAASTQLIAKHLVDGGLSDLRCIAEPKMAEKWFGHHGVTINNHGQVYKAVEQLLAHDAIAGTMWAQAMTSDAPGAMQAVAATREATRPGRIAAEQVNGPGGAETQGDEPETSQEPSV